MTTKASARQAMPPSRNARGVEPPLVAATPETLSSIAMPGASTDTEIAMASGSRRVPRASWLPVATPDSERVWAMGRVPFTAAGVWGRPYGRFWVGRGHLPLGNQAVSGVLLGHQDGLVIQDVVEGKRDAVARVEPGQEGLVHWMVAVGGHRVEIGEFGVEQLRVPAGAGPGDVGAQPALGHQADLPRPGRHHRAPLGLVLGAERAGKAEQDDVLEGHRSSSVELEVLAHFPVADVLPVLRRGLSDVGLVASER